MKVDNWFRELHRQIKDFDDLTLDSDIKMADITLGYVDTEGSIHYHIIEYRAKGFENKKILNQSNEGKTQESG